MTRPPLRFSIGLAAVCFAVSVAACGGGDAPKAPPPPAVSAAATVAPSATSEPGVAIGRFDDGLPLRSGDGKLEV